MEAIKLWPDEEHQLTAEQIAEAVVIGRSLIGNDSGPIVVLTEDMTSDQRKEALRYLLGMESKLCLRTPYFTEQLNGADNGNNN